MVTTFVNHRNYGCRGGYLCALLYLFNNMPYYSKSNKKHPYSSFFYDNDDEHKPDFNHTFYFEPLSSLMVRVSNFKNLVILHFAKGNRYLPMREDEFNDLIAMHESIMGQIKKCKKVIRMIYKKPDSNEEE